jgi:hypothetical protein
MILPSFEGGMTTCEVGWLNNDARVAAVWHKAFMDRPSGIHWPTVEGATVRTFERNLSGQSVEVSFEEAERRYEKTLAHKATYNLVDAGWSSFEDAMVALEPHIPLYIYAFIPVETGWCVYMNNSPLGTDTAFLPHRFTGDGLGMAVRAVHVPSIELHPVRILTAHSPNAGGDPKVRLLWADKSGKKGFKERGARFDFESETEFAWSWSISVSVRRCCIAIWSGWGCLTIGNRSGIKRCW